MRMWKTIRWALHPDPVRQFNAIVIEKKVFLQKSMRSQNISRFSQQAVVYCYKAWFLFAGRELEGSGIMAVSYKKLFKILIDRDMKKKEFREYVGISYSTLSKLEKGENTNVDVLERICLKMDCRIEDIMEILPDQQPDPQTTEQSKS